MTMNGIVIRPIKTHAEAELCAQMMASSEPWKTLRRDYSASLKTISDPAKEVYLAVVNKAVAGFIILNMTGAFVGYIQSVCVGPHWRGRGIGSALMAFAEARIFRDTPNAFICVSSFNPQAQALYQRLGYAVIGELKDYVVAGHSEILMRKTVGPLMK
jgi:[ribosomal protein S18]-alanine N-acetyltransferase